MAQGVMEQAVAAADINDNPSMCIPLAAARLTATAK